MDKILVTGATGFIGHYVVTELLQKGYEVIASSANREKAEKAPWYKQVRYVPFDLEKFDPATDYYQFFGQPHRLLHLAWEGLPQYKADFHLEINYPRHAALLANLVSHGLKDMTVTGTCFEYGMQEGCLREDMPALPANPYAIAKNKLRLQLEDLQKKTPFLLRWPRLFYMYGKGQSPNSLLSQLDRALAAGEKVFNMSGGQQVRDYLPVEKVAEYLADIATQQHVGGIINCCSGDPVTVKELVERHLRNRHATITLNLGFYPYPDYEPMRFWGDNTKLKTIFENAKPGT
jgi:dTDP-6-deoxy-L-talose 4-dehydrogenase (NAD+)